MSTNTAIVHEQIIRLTAFSVVLAFVLIGEIWAPRRRLENSKMKRWTNNFSLLAINSLLVRLLFPAAAVGFAAFAEAHTLGLLHVWVFPELIAIALAVLLLDVAIYVQHRAFHAVPTLWRVHRVHHADPDFDISTGLRFHPIEILFSMVIKFLVIVALGPPVVAVLIFETMLNITAMFNHANIRLPLKIDTMIRQVIVTPDMHRIHHSVDNREANSNFGFCFSVWDRLLRTYRLEPRLGHIAMNIGLVTARDPKQVTELKGLLSMPFAPLPSPANVAQSPVRDH